MAKAVIVKEYIKLMRVRIGLLVLITTSIGFFLAKGEAGMLTFLSLLIGVALAQAGSSTLNQYLERDHDARMERTKTRPIPSGAVTPANALVFGIILTLGGVVWLLITVNLLTSFLVLLAAFLYCLVYTPMKRLTWFNTYVGAVPGAIPPLSGWAAATGNIEGAAAWALFLIMFIWQHPHFYAIAWILKEEYKQAGFKMMPVVYPDGTLTFLHIVLYSAALIPASLLPFLLGISGKVYFAGALALSCSLFMISLYLSCARTDSSARYLFRASIVYLPLLFALIIADQWIYV